LTRGSPVSRECGKELPVAAWATAKGPSASASAFVPAGVTGLQPVSFIMARGLLVMFVWKYRQNIVT
jgi:hypothetical protein